jgi:hypothetical protein
MPTPIAHRVKFHDARRAFAAGSRVLVSEYGDELSRPVYPHTSTHSRDTTTWDALVAQVAEWRHRYPRQRFYVITEAS